MDKIFLSRGDSFDFKNSLKSVKSEHISSFCGVEIHINDFLPNGVIVVCGAKLSDEEKFSYIPGSNRYSVVYILNVGT